jgi:hypothetical protein
VARSLEAARKQFAGRTGKVKVDCRGDSRCVAAVDGAPADARKAIYVMAGPHAVVVQRGEERFERLVDVGVDATVVVATPAGERGVEAARESGTGTGTGTARARARARRDESGISPAWFFVGTGVTVVLGVATAFSGADASKKHDRFASDGCGPGGVGRLPLDCEQQGQEGKNAQLRTNLLLGATAVLATTTAAVGIFAVKWKSGASARLTVGTQRSAALAGFELVTP